MEWNVLIELLDPKLLIVLGACWVFGFILKQTPKVPNWSIVYFVTCLAIVSSILILGLTTTSVLQGVIAGAMAVYGNQIVKQTMEATKKKEDIQTPSPEMIASLEARTKFHERQQKGDEKQ